MSTLQDNGLVSTALASPFILSAAAFLLVACLIRFVLIRPSKLDLPVVDIPDGDASKALLTGSAKYPDTPWILPLVPPMVILPFSSLDEVRNLPETKVSFTKEIYRMFIGRYTGIGHDSPILIKAVKTDLTRHIASTLTALQDEMRYSLDKEFGPCEDWTSVNLYSKLLRIVALLSGRVFVGRPLSRNEEWIDISIKYTMDCSASRTGILKYPGWLRPFVAPFIPEVRKLREHKEVGKRLLKPLMEVCSRRFTEGKVAHDDEFDDEQGTFVTWMMKYMDEKTRADSENLAAQQLTLSFAAIHTTTMATSHAIYDLVTHPEYIRPLREEIERVMEEDGYEIDEENPHLKNLNKASLPKLKLLDSFLKESQRFSPAGYIANSRLTTSDLALSTGHTIPKGTRIGFNALMINNKGPNYQLTSESDLKIAPPTEFSPFRFASLREIPGHESKHQFVTTSHDSLNFGHGSHACPGRFFAGTEIKVVLVELLRNWDLRLPAQEEGKEKEGRERRPKNFTQEVSIMPNPFAEVEFRRRRV
ncbi:cytochrome p450 monooxygenase protein [Rutstroemia sp. NJR-2017a WRK4]|nr:cytochrome p450 monooxygenase protein [Rutstroemia sp. NJR-2017a WRK4]